MNNIKNIIKKVLLETIIKEDCGCGCNESIDCFKPPILNENLNSRVIMTENLKYHIDNKKSLFNTPLPYGSKEYLDLWAEARYLYSRGVLNVEGIDKEKITKTNLGEYGLYEGKKVPLDLLLPNNKMYTRVDGKIVESTNPNIYLIYCRIVVNSDARPMQDILSDIRAIPGVTIVDIVSADEKTHGIRHVVDISLKIDPAPFEPFSSKSYSQILDDVKKIPSVYTAKYISTPKSVKESLNEVKAEHISIGDTFNISVELGKFKSGTKVRVDSIRPSGNDIVLTLSDGKTKDKFYLDKNDDFGELDENEEEEEGPAPTPSTPSGNISLEDAKDLLKNTKGKFFTVTFIKKDGTERVMNARLGVKVYLKGGQLAYDAESKGLLPVYDMKEKGYRMINLNTISHIKIGNNNYDVIKESLNENTIKEPKTEIPNIQYYQNVLDKSNGLSRENRAFFQSIINSIRKQNNMASPRQKVLLARLRTGNFNYGPRGN